MKFEDDILIKVVEIVDIEFKKNIKKIGYSSWYEGGDSAGCCGPTFGKFGHQGHQESHEVPKQLA